MDDQDVKYDLKFIRNYKLYFIYIYILLSNIRDEVVASRLLEIKHRSSRKDGLSYNFCTEL